jgi:hypothetical protein
MSWFLARNNYCYSVTYFMVTVHISTSFSVTSDQASVDVFESACERRGADGIDARA